MSCDVMVTAVDMDRRTVEFGLEGETMKTSSGKFERRAPKGAPARRVSGSRRRRQRKMGEAGEYYQRRKTLVRTTDR